MQNNFFISFQLDCWDGIDGEPLIYHGWTLTSKLIFKDVLMDAIKPYSFQSSPYPLILSIENHCSKEQQDKMAEHFVNILGDLLFKEQVDTTLSQLPSPESLKNKILIKAKKIKLKSNGSIDTNDDIVDQPFEDIRHDRNDSKKSNRQNSKKSERKDSVDSKRSSEENDLTKSSFATKSRALSDLVNYAEAVKFTNFEDTRQFWEMSSFEESKIGNILSNEKTERKLFSFNQTNLSRIYPKGTRFLSSNLDPILPWAAGCQMVALNFQASDKINMMNRAKFLQNGNCGYVLKPDYGDCYTLQSSDEKHDFGKVMELSIKLISGYHLPNATNRPAGDIIEPYVKMRVHGHPSDTYEWTSATVPRNGFNPLWNEVATFNLSYPEYTLIEFKVKSKTKIVGGQDDHLGSYIIALPLMRKGYRNISLENYDGQRLTPAGLFVHITMKEASDKCK